MNLKFSLDAIHAGTGVNMALTEKAGWPMWNMAHGNPTQIRVSPSTVVWFVIGVAVASEKDP